MRAATECNVPHPVLFLQLVLACSMTVATAAKRYGCSARTIRGGAKTPGWAVRTRAEPGALPLSRARLYRWGGRRDGLFRGDLVMLVEEARNGLAARFDFILDIR